MKIATVVMPTFNAQSYIIEAIESVLAQSIPEFDLYILDGGSTDLTIEIAKYYMKQDSRVKLYILPGSHPAVRVNEALRTANSKYIAFMHSDDISSSDRLKIQSEFLDENPDHAMVGSATHYWLHEKRHPELPQYSSICTYPSIHEIIKVKMLFWWCFSHPSTMINREYVNKIQLKFEPRYKYIADYLFNYRLSNHYKVENLQTPLLSYRHHLGSDGPTHLPEINAETLLLKEEIIKSSGFARYMTDRQIDIYLKLRIEQDNIMNPELFTRDEMQCLCNGLKTINKTQAIHSTQYFNQVVDDYFTKWGDKPRESRNNKNSIRQRIRKEMRRAKKRLSSLLGIPERHN